MKLVDGVFIHPTALIDPQAELGARVYVGPYCVVGADVRLGDDVQLQSHVVIQGPTTLEESVYVFPFAVLGEPPQDRTFHGERTSLLIGAQTVIREHVTAHRGTEKGGAETRIGKHNLLMATCHIAHDVSVGNHCILANATQLAGHVVVQDYVVFGGAAAVAPFQVIGESAFVAAGAMVEQSVPPYHIAQGDRARVRALNIVGLKRRGFSSSDIQVLTAAHKILYRQELTMAEAFERLELVSDRRVQQLVLFLKTHQTMGKTR